ncbi:MAG: DNA repair protein RadC [Bacteroidetes bacterium]|jgi:DNA repair protein RadC|nr:DNA repair protein RadC [Bacteroidota bacterium]
MLNNSIKNWSEDDRPREKLLLKGSNALSNAELLAILINNGTRNKSAVDLAKELMQCVNNDLQKLGQLGVKEMVNLKVKGLGEAKAIAIVAALELGIRRGAVENKKEIITSSKDAAVYLQSFLQYKPHEIFMALFLNQGNRVLHSEVISEGGITGTVVDIRILMKKALQHNTTGIILCHNHPSGNLKPSKADKDLTQKITDAAKLLDIIVNDHIIVSNEGYYSFADEGLI